LKDTYKEADLILARIMEFSSPRRPSKWGKVIEEYLKLDEAERDNLTKFQVQGLIDWFKPGAKKKRSAEEKKQKKKRQEAKTKAKKVRELPANKKQEWSHRANRNWSYTGDVDDDGNDETKVHSRRPRSFRDAQYDPETTIKRLLGVLSKGQGTTFIKALAKEINSDLRDTRLHTSYGLAAYDGEGVTVKADGGIENNPEFAEGFEHGALPVPGKKLSGNARKLLGERDDKELDVEALKGSHNLGRDREGRTVAQATKAFSTTWKQDQAEVRKQEQKDRKEGRKLVAAAD
jgi:hypothetical protein